VTCKQRGEESRI